jgi:branched-chain amino acid transport system permease protein
VEIFDIFLLEAVVNGILLGGLLGLLSLGLNLIFGVIDVVWICYAELIMIGMYAVFMLHAQYGWPLLPAMAPIVVGEISISAPRVIAFFAALAGVAATWLLLTRTYMGTAIRAISQDRAIMPLMGVNPDRVFVVTSALGGALAGLGACLLVLQYDIHPAIGLSFGPIVFLICVLGGLGNMLGGLVASFIFAQFISVGGFFLHIEWGYVLAFAFFIAVMFWRPQGILATK